jgi:hypothetical protein
MPRTNELLQRGIRGGKVWLKSKVDLGTSREKPTMLRYVRIENFY